MVLEGAWVVPGIAPPGPSHYPIPRVHPSRTMPVVYMTSVLPRGVSGRVNMVVGLKSVAQLTLEY